MAEGHGHFGRAVLVVVGLTSVLISRPHSNGVDTVDIAVGSTGVKFLSSVSSSPDIDVPLTTSPLQ